MELASWGNQPLGGIASTRDLARIRAGIRSGVMTTFHYCGTCRMGADERSPVDLQLRLKGIGNVRVADASVIPEIPVSALNAPSMMIGYRAAELILQNRSASAGQRVSSVGHAALSA